MILGTKFRKVFDPLHIATSLSVAGGATTQEYNADTKEYLPDRTLTPLTIIPLVSIVDHSGAMPSGDKTSSIVNVKWYENEIKAASIITAENTGYTLSTNGKLIVRKNILANRDLTLIYTGQFVDPRNNQVTDVMKWIILSTTEASETPLFLSLTTPCGFRYNPLKPISRLSIKANLLLGETPANGKYWWYKSLGSAYELITAETAWEVVSGWDASELIIDPRYLTKKVVFRCIADYVPSGTTAPAVPSARAVQDETVLLVSYTGWYAELSTQNAGAITFGMQKSTSLCQIMSNSRILDNPEKAFSMRWKKTSGDIIAIGPGMEVSSKDVTVDILGTEVQCEILEREPLKALSVGGTVITIGGKIIVA